jgi:hypothetical protein
MKKNHQMSNHIETLIIRKNCKEDKKINIDIIKEEDGIIININGIGHQKSIIKQDIMIDQHLLQIGEASTMIHGIKGRKIMHNKTPRIKNKKELILNGWIIINGRKKLGT